eukprot:CAMPEP_0206479424 /NCGR_PEP_ID=MMETSP0324_2-20121206/36661_1 /ASSEMBLY_ACC=CAM_ASM_000836 /TAXON_ID=2866 /ORGANISM="Crypthecodinium cohnii, Strain Seligo" /LENGTH=84 /DNA_ID=CAMNT_0053955959 /DNA_START=392 /DNA_END=643 /DNA_ORIENTATION=+
MTSQLLRQPDDAVGAAAKLLQDAKGLRAELEGGALRELVDVLCLDGWCGIFLAVRFWRGLAGGGWSRNSRRQATVQLLLLLLLL